MTHSTLNFLLALAFIFNRHSHFVLAAATLFIVSDSFSKIVHSTADATDLLWTPWGLSVREFMEGFE